MLKHRVFLLRNWEKMREKQELLKREGERERDASSLSIYARWGGVIRDDGNIKSGRSAGLGAPTPAYRGETCQFWGWVKLRFTHSLSKFINQPFH